MSRVEESLRQDRELRDAARAVFLADIEHAKTSFSAKGMAQRIGGRIGDGAKDVYEVAKVQADDNRGIIAVLIGAIALWFSREPILELLGLSATDAADEGQASEPTPEPDGAEQDPPPPAPGDDHD